MAANLGAINYDEHIHVPLFGSASIPVHVIIRGMWETTIDFNFAANSYTFTFTKWSRNGMGRLLELFHSHAPRDPVLFGARLVDAQGNVDMTQITTEHKHQTVIQAVRDVFSVVDHISTKYQRSLVDYAIWHRERFPEDSYPSYIEKLASHLIVHANILGPNVQWEQVHF
jgi:hypothetical protein